MTILNKYLHFKMMLQKIVLFVLHAFLQLRFIAVDLQGLQTAILYCSSTGLPLDLSGCELSG